MSRLVVKFGHQKNQLFELPDGETVIGRDEAALLLPNVSVSRQHARILRGSQNVTIEDLDSQNGTFVNGERVQQAVLASRDEINIGKFTLIFLTRTRDDRFYKGRYVGYLPKYDPGTILPDQAATFALSIEALKAMNVGNRLVENARLISEADPKRFWFPEDRGLSFGGAGLVPVSGWFTWGVVAAVQWDGSKHVVLKKGLLTRVAVNGAAVQRQALKAGDRVSIGGSHFRYEAPA